MANWSGIAKQLKKERDLVEKQLSALNAALTAFVGAYSGSAKSKPKRKMSAAGRKRIAAAQRARWAKVKAGKKAA
jgi:hypothetical protein